MGDAKSAFKNVLLRYKEQNKLSISFTSNDGGEHISNYSKKPIRGAIIIIEIDDDSYEKPIFKISNAEHNDIFGYKLG